MKNGFLVTAILAAALSGTAVADNRADAEKRKDEGNVLYGRKDYAGAIEKFQASIAADSTYAFGWNNLGMAYYETGDFHAAILHLERAVAIDPLYAKAFNNLGNACLAAGEYARARETYSRSIELQPGIDQKHINLGNALYGLGAYTDAAAEYRKALELNRDSAEAQNNLGAALQSLGDKERATEAYLAAIRINSRFTDAYINLGVLHYDNGAGDMDKAVFYFEQALLQEEDNPRAVYNLGLALYAKGDFQNALERLRLLETKIKDDPDLTYAVGRAYAAVDNHPIAIRKYKQVLDMAPDYERARTALAISEAAGR